MSAKQGSCWKNYMDMNHKVYTMQIKQVLFHNLSPNKMFAVKGESCNGGKESKDSTTAVLDCNADESGQSEISKFLLFKKCQNKTNKQQSLVHSDTFMNYLRALDANTGPKNRKILLSTGQCPAQQERHLDLKNVNAAFFIPNCTHHLQPLDLGTINSFTCYYQKQLMRKGVALTDRGLL
jgi:hypothetical protein